MATFTFDIEHPDVIYTNKVTSIQKQKCNTNVTASDAIELLNTNLTQPAFIQTYSGDAKSKLVLTSIVADNDINLERSSTVLTNADLPLEIDISSTGDTDNVDTLVVELDTTSSISTTKVLLITFYIEDENGQIGESITSSFQYSIVKCGSGSSITSTLPIVSDTSGNVNYQIVANNLPTNYYITGLPKGITYNASTGLISGTSTQVDTHNISIFITNEFGTTQTDTTLQIINNSVSVPVINSPLSISLPPNVNIDLFGYQITATNNPDTFIYGIPTDLQPFIKVSSTDPSVIGGSNFTLPAGQTYNISITAGNGAGLDVETLQITT